VVDPPHGSVYTRQQLAIPATCQENTVPKTPVVTTKLSRFQDALTLLCGERPSQAMCQEWLLDLNDDLQGWVIDHLSPLVPWATGIGTIDAAYAMAEEPEEGEDYDHQF
jgi:hypothetical protein